MWQIYSLGDVAFLTSVFNALAAIFAGGVLLTAVKIFLLLAMLQLALAGMLTGRGIDFSRLLVSWLLFSLLFVPKTSVLIADRSTLNSRVVDNVRLGLVAFASLTSQLGYNLSEIFTTSMGTTLTGSTSGVTRSFEGIVELRTRVLSVLSLKNSGQLHDLQQGWKNYLEDCTEVGLTIQPDASHALEITGVLRKSLPDALLFSSEVYYTHLPLNGKDVSLTCNQAYQQLVSALTASAESLRGYWSRGLTGASSWGGISGSAGITSGLLGGVSGSSTSGKNTSGSLTSLNLDTINQDLSSLSQGQLDAQRYMLALSMASIVEGVAPYTSLAQALTATNLAQTYASWSLQGQVFWHTLKPILTFLEGFFFAVSRIIMLLMLLGNYGLGLVGKYGLLLVWLQLWHPIIAIINLYYHHTIALGIQDLQQTSVALDSLQGIAFFNQQLESYMGTAGLLLSSVGTLALFLLYGGAVTATSLVGRLAPEAPTVSKSLSPDVVQAAPVLAQRASYTFDTYQGLRMSGAEAQIGSVALGSSLERIRSSTQANLSSQSQQLSNIAAHSATIAASTSAVTSSSSSITATQTSTQMMGSSQEISNTTAHSSTTKKSFASSENSTLNGGASLSLGGSTGAGGSALNSLAGALGTNSVGKVGANLSGGYSTGLTKAISQGVDNSNTVAHAEQTTDSTSTNQSAATQTSTTSGTSYARSRNVTDATSQQEQTVRAQLASSTRTLQATESFAASLGASKNMSVLALAQAVVQSPSLQHTLQQLVGSDTGLAARAYDYQRNYVSLIPNSELRNTSANLAALFDARDNSQGNQQRQDAFLLAYLQQGGVQVLGWQDARATNLSSATFTPSLSASNTGAGVSTTGGVQTVTTPVSTSEQDRTQIQDANSHQRQASPQGTTTARPSLAPQAWQGTSNYVVRTKVSLRGVREQAGMSTSESEHESSQPVPSRPEPSTLSSTPARSKTLRK